VTVHDHGATVRRAVDFAKTATPADAVLGSR
jgi:hypothetical protein